MPMPKAGFLPDFCVYLPSVNKNMDKDKAQDRKFLRWARDGRDLRSEFSPPKELPKVSADRQISLK